MEVYPPIGSIDNFLLKNLHISIYLYTFALLNKFDMINFTQQQIDEIISQYKLGKSLIEIAEEYSVCRATIKKVLKGNYPAYIGKRRALRAAENQAKICSKCGRELPLSAFNKGNSLYGRRSFCRECEHSIQNSPEYVARRRKNTLKKRENPEYVIKSNKTDTDRRHNNDTSLKLCLLRSAKQRAKVKGLDFNIDITDINLPDKCPLLNIPLGSFYREATDNSYSIDRIDSSKGYTKGNVWVISKRANTLKGNATLEELELLVKNLRRKIKGE